MGCSYDASKNLACIYTAFAVMYGNSEKNQLSFRNNTAIYHPVNNELLQKYNRT